MEIKVENYWHVYDKNKRDIYLNDKIVISYNTQFSFLSHCFGILGGQKSFRRRKDNELEFRRNLIFHNGEFPKRIFSHYEASSV